MTEPNFKLPIQVIVITEGYEVESLTTSGKLKKGERYRIIMIRDDGRVALSGREPGEWFPMRNFCTVG